MNKSFGALQVALFMVNNEIQWCMIINSMMRLALRYGDALAQAMMAERNAAISISSLITIGEG